MKAVAQGCLAGVLALVCSGVALGQESKSTKLAQQLAAALDAAKLDSIAAKDPSNSGVYIGALYLPGLQLLAVSAQYSAPLLLDARLVKHEYRDIYIELNSAASPGSQLFIEDLGIDGLKAQAEKDGPFDSFEDKGKRTAFNSDWGRQKLSEQEYLKIFAAADQRYAEMLMALLGQLKKGM